MDNQENKLSIKSPSVESTWTEHDHWLFLNAVVNLPENITGRWQKVSDAIPGKTADEVKAYHDWWEHKLTEIEDENDDDNGEESNSALKTNDHISFVSQASETMAKHEVKERKKGTPWTVEEHRRFLEGLKVFGKGDWRSISRILVVTRTATQVASHAQKYFLRQKAEKKQKKRSSIHDITTTEMETAIVVHAQPTPTPSPLPPPTPPATSGERGVPTPPTLSPPNFDGGQRRGAQPQPPLALDSPLKPRELNFYVGEGSGTQSPLVAEPISCYTDERGGASSLPSSNLCWEGQGGIIDFYVEQGGAALPLTGNHFQNFIYQPY